MKVEKLILGKIDNNTYIVSNNGKCVIVDPSDGFLEIMEAVKKSGAVVEAILITHAHWDHVFSLNQIKAATGAPIYMHQDDQSLLTRSMTRIGESVPEIDVLVKGGESFEVIDMDCRVLHTPGHAKGCVCYLMGDAMFCGDTLFRNSIGRTDLSTSNPTAMEQTIVMLAQIKEDYTLYPGHGDESTLQYEIENNPYFIQARG